MKSATQTMLLGAIATVVIGCGTEAGDDAPAENDTHGLVVQAKLDGGGRLSIREITPGRLVSFYIGKHDALRAEFEALEHGQLSHSDLFRIATGQPAPKTLLDAEHRMKRVLEEAEKRRTDEGETQADGPDELDVSAPSAVLESADSLEGEADSTSKFISRDRFRECFCPRDWEYLYCWPSVTGSAGVTRTGHQMVSYLALLSGNGLSYSYQYRDVFGDWHVIASETVFEGELMRMHESRSLLSVTRRIRVRNASGDRYHLSIYGLNSGLGPFPPFANDCPVAIN